jgi:hypothetical protein
MRRLDSHLARSQRRASRARSAASRRH